MKINMKSNLIMIWEGMGIVSIVLLLCLPNGKTMMNTILGMFNVKSATYIGLSIADFVAMLLFLLIYFSSFKFLAKDKTTKLFSISASSLMIITLVSRIMFI